MKCHGANRNKISYKLNQVKKKATLKLPNCDKKKKPLEFTIYNTYYNSSANERWAVY